MEEKKVKNILENFSKIEIKLSSLGSENYEEYAKLSKEYSDLKPLVEKSREFLKLRNEFQDTEELMLGDDLEIRKEVVHI